MQEIINPLSLIKSFGTKRLNVPWPAQVTEPTGSYIKPKQMPALPTSSNTTKHPSVLYYGNLSLSY